jgi:hypothetical protein
MRDLLIIYVRLGPVPALNVEYQLTKMAAVITWYCDTNIILDSVCHTYFLSI